MNPNYPYTRKGALHPVCHVTKKSDDSNAQATGCSKKIEQNGGKRTTEHGSILTSYPQKLNSSPKLSEDSDFSTQVQNIEHSPTSNPEKKPYSDKAAKTTVINQEFLGSSVKDASDKFRVLCVRSDMGTGKTTAMKAIIKDLPEDAKVLFLSSRRKLLRELSVKLSLSYYEDITGVDKDNAKEMTKRLAITPQSLHKVLNASIEYDYIVIDESESVASMLVSDATGDKVKVLKALKTVVASASHVIAMDAFLGVRTKKLLSVITGESNPRYLVNKFKRWDKISAFVIDGSSYSERVKSSDSMQVAAVQQGQRIAISTSSAEYAYRRYEVLKAIYPDKKILLITGKETPEGQRVIDNPDLVVDYDILIFSPAVSIGVSFDIENHFHTVFGVYPNVSGTGDSDDAVQGMARIRHPALNQWVVVLDDEKQVIRGVDDVKTPADIQQILTDRFAGAKFFAGSTEELCTESLQVLDLYSTCQHYRITDKNNFNSRFADKLHDMGVSIETLVSDDIAPDLQSEALTEDAKLAKQELKNAERTKSKKIDEKEFDRLGAIQKFRPDEITDDKRASMARYRFEDKFNIDCDTAEPALIEKCLALDDNGAIAKCKAREIANAEPDFDKAYVKSRIEGLHGGDSFKVSPIDKKLNYLLRKRLLAYALPYIDGKEYSHASLKRGALLQFVEAHEKKIIVCEVMALPKNWRKKPALLVNHLLETIGYRHTHSQRRVKGKVQRIYTAIPDANIDELCQMRIDTGKGWVTQTKRIMGIIEQLSKIPEFETRIDRLWHEAGRTDDIQAFLSEFADDIQDIENGVFDDEIMLKIVANWGV